MRVLHALFLILAIVSTPSEQTKTHYSKESYVEWENCGPYAQCFCSDEQTPPKLSTQFASVPKASDGPPPTPDAEIGLCNIGIHSMYFNPEDALFQMQIIGQDVENNPELMLYHGSNLIFGCKFKGSNPEDVELIIGTMTGRWKISSFEHRSRFEKGNIICAIQVLRADILYAYLKRHHTSDKTSIKLITSSTVSYERREGNTYYFDMISNKCNPLSLGEIPRTQKYHVLPLKNKHKDSLKCSEDYDDRYTLRYEKSTDVTVVEYEAQELNCYDHEIASKHKFYYTIVEDGIAPTVPPKPLKTGVTYTFYCAAKFEELCVNPTGNCPNDGSICPTFSIGAKNTPATLTCEDHKWIIDGEYVKLTEDVLCKQDIISNPSNAAFYTTLPGGNVKNIPGQRCFTEYNCKAKSALDYPKECNGESDCFAIEYNDGTMKCKDPTHSLRIHNYKDNSTIKAEKYTCDTNTGEWKNATGGIIQANSRVRCLSDANISYVHAAKEEITDGMIHGIVGGVAAAAVVIIVGGVLLTLYCLKRRQNVGVQKRKKWLKMKKEDRINAIKENFGRILKSTPYTSDNIPGGLRFIDLLLDTETDHFEIWDEVHMFLLRFHGAIIRVDHSIWHLFSRYMYLQAKKIIDKHGWLTTKRLNAKNQNGMIRVVAIRLLEFCIYDNTCSEAEELIGDGFRKLGFNAVEQYPHCGLLWSLFLQTRPTKCMEENGTRISTFDRTGFVNTLKDIAWLSKIVMPKEDIIPEYGSIAEQAAFALGANPDTFFRKKYTWAYLTDEKKVKTAYKEVAMNFYAGICGSLTHNPAPIVIECFRMWPTLNKGFLDKMKEALPPGSVTAIAQKTIMLEVFYGRNIDAKRLQVRLIANQDPVEFSTLQAEQHDFEEAMEDVKDDLRSWFAERTDKEELKIKRNPITNANYKLDNRIEGETVKDVEGGTKSSSNTKSNSDSNSDTKVERSGTPPEGSKTPLGGGNDKTPENGLAPAAPNAAAQPAANVAAAAPAAAPAPVKP